jgi:hypothetical protein
LLGFLVQVVGDDSEHGAFKGGFVSAGLVFGARIDGLFGKSPQNFAQCFGGFGHGGIKKFIAGWLTVASPLVSDAVCMNGAGSASIDAGSVQTLERMQVFPVADQARSGVDEYSDNAIFLMVIFAGWVNRPKVGGRTGEIQRRQRLGRTTTDFLPAASARGEKCDDSELGRYG